MRAGWSFGQTIATVGWSLGRTIAEHDTAPSLAAPGAGERLGRYTLLEVLGEGGMGVVYLAYDADLDRRVALKLLRSSNDADENGRERLLREARALARLAHPNVVPVFDVGEARSHTFVTMEYVEGATLTEWLRLRPRSLAQILATFCEAGRGLIAAHAIGIVHRDFKPDNVFIGKDASDPNAAGRVRVGDFGLARASEVAVPTAPESGEPIDASTVDVRLTRAGVVLGTPAYMAPEQHLGQPITPASDQYAFCLALWEAVYGMRPFVAESARRLLDLKLAREVAAMPEHARVPAWLRQALLRGLEPVADKRWPTLAELVSLLEQRRRRAKRALWWLGAAGLVALGVALAWPREHEPCDASRRIAAEWNDARRSAIATRFDDTGLAYAHDTWTRTAALLDGWSERWITARDQACRAAHEPAQAGVDLDARMGCLDTRLHELEDLLEVFDEADAEIVARAVTASTHLPALHPCMVAVSHDELPADPRLRERVVQIERMIGRARVLENTGRFDALRLQADRIEAEVEGVAWPPVQASVLHTLGSARERVGDYDSARERFTEALWSAVAIGDDRLAAQTAIELVWLEGVDATDDAAAQNWQRHAEAAITRLGGSLDERARLANALGAMHEAAGRHAEAHEQFQIALAGFEATDRELAGYEGVGSALPDVATALQNIGITLSGAGRDADARAPLERALAVCEQLDGPDHPDAASTRDALGGVLLRLGEYAAAREALEHALRSRQGALPPDHPDIARSHNNLGSLFEATGELALAEEHYRRALKIFEGTLGPEHAMVGATLVNLGSVLAREGRKDEARETLQRAVAMLEAALPLEHPYVAWATLVLGRTELGRGEPALARAWLERSHLSCERAALEPALCGAAAFYLALARERTGDSADRVRPLVQHAAKELERSGKPGEPELKEAKAWLAKH
jgi:eukaryotic-like serine/threonine-protein kinase